MHKRPQLLDRELFRAARREALSFSFWTDGVVYPMLAGGIGMFWTGVAGIGLFSVSLAAAGILSGSAFWAWGYRRRRDQHAALIMKERASQLVQKRDQEMMRLEGMLQADGMTEASRQIRDLRAGFDALKTVLEQKLGSGELGYQRFRIVLEELFLSSLDNLEHAVERLHAALAIGIDDVEAKLHRIEAEGDDPNSMELIELERARTRYEALTESARELFEQNTIILATLQQSCARITGVQAHRAKFRRELDALLAEFTSMADGYRLAGT